MLNYVPQFIKIRVVFPSRFISETKTVTLIFLLHFWHK